MVKNCVGNYLECEKDFCIENRRCIMDLRENLFRTISDEKTDIFPDTRSRMIDTD